MTESLYSPEPESLSQRASRRLRGCMAENRISQTDLARVLHMPQQKVSRKVNGQTPLTIDEIDLVASALGIEVDAILGIGRYADRPIGVCSIRDAENPRAAEAGGGQEEVRHQGLEPRTRWLTAVPTFNDPEPLERELAPVIDLTIRRSA